MKTFPVRPIPGDDLKQRLDTLALEKRWLAAILLTGIGSLDGAMIRFADRPEATRIEGALEILSLSGTLSPDGSHHDSSRARWRSLTDLPRLPRRICPGFHLEITLISCSFPTMHRLLMLLLVFGAFAGLGERLLAQVGIHGHDVVLTDDCCHDHGDRHSQDEDPHGPDCPPGPHHHHAGACCGGTLAVEEPEVCRLRLAAGVRTGWDHPDEAAPDGPVLSMDKPPLI